MKPKKTQSLPISFANGKNADTNNIVHTKITLRGESETRCFFTDVYVLSECNPELLLGLPFLEQTDFHCDFQNKKFTFGKITLYSEENETENNGNQLEKKLYEKLEVSNKGSLSN